MIMEVSATAPGQSLFNRVLEQMRSMPLRILELGTRRVAGNPSTVRRAMAHPASEYIATDFMAGEDVDVIADAHCLAKTFPQNHFDLVLSCSTYEHFSRPWIATKEIVAVLRPGGTLFIQTHQSFPLHGFPNDYFRFSREALHLLCEDAGLTAIETAYEFPASIVSDEDLEARKHEAYLNVVAIAIKPERRSLISRLGRNFVRPVYGMITKRGCRSCP
jgi:SAM-dependent methyltransferase